MKWRDSVLEFLLIAIYSGGKATTLGEVVDDLLAYWRQKTATLHKLAGLAVNFREFQQPAPLLSDLLSSQAYTQRKSNSAI